MKLRPVAVAVLLGILSIPVRSAPPVMSKQALATDPKHNPNGNGCNFCHAPHNGGSGSSGTLLLWSQAYTTVTTFGVYQSTTLSVQAEELGGQAPVSSDVKMYSLLCMSCHDGVTTTFTGMNFGTGTTGMRTSSMVGSVVNGAAGSYGLTNDHPVNIVYNSAQPTLVQPAPVNVLPFYGTNNTVQCSTCHEPHNNTNGNYLRQPNTANHCLTCHS